VARGMFTAPLTRMACVADQEIRHRRQSRCKSPCLPTSREMADAGPMLGLTWRSVYFAGVTWERPHWQRFDRKELEACWAAIGTLDIADKMTLLRELATDIALAGAKRRNNYQMTVAAVMSLRSAAEILGRSPTQYEYRRLTAELPELDLVPDGTLRRWLGGNWNQCLARALLDAVSEGDFVTLCEGDSFSEAELVEAIRMYIAEHDDRIPTFSQLMIWTHMPSVRARPGRRPLSHAPFTRLGGYPAVLERNGIVSKDARRFDLRGRMLPLAWRFTDEELRAAVNQVTVELGRPPREADYLDARDAQRVRVAAGNAPAETILPSVSTLKKRFGPTWSDVLEAAGHPRLESTRRARQPLHHSRVRWERDEVLEAVNQAWVEVGEPFTKDAYMSWRKRKLALAAKNGEPLRIPHSEPICRMFGGWPQACDACLPPSTTKRRRRRKTHGG
jgi:Homing endonuclease associated repeat